jgi:hypothetical protein
MRAQACLGRLIVVRHDGQNGIGATCLGVLAQLDGGSGRIRAGSRDHRYPAACDVDCEADECTVLSSVQRGRFAGCSAHDQCGAALVDLPMAELLESRAVDVPVVVEWGGHSGA